MKFRSKFVLRLALIFLAVLLVFGLTRFGESKAPDFTGSSRIKAPEVRAALDTIERKGHYTTHPEVAAYLYQYGTLPSNYRTKEDHRKDKGDPEAWAVGGSHFGNFEGLLPEDDYREADVNMTPKSRGPERLVYSDDGDIYYTQDHYASFVQLVEGTHDDT